MNNNNEIILRPASVYAFIRIISLALAALAFLFLAWSIAPLFILAGIAFAVTAVYRYALTKYKVFIIAPEFIRIKTGLFFKRVDQVEMYRIKDYVITRPLLHQLLRIMNLTLKTTDPENPVIDIKGIPDSRLVDLIRDRVQQARKANKIVEIS